MKNLIIASNNEHKLHEYRAILSDYNILCPKDLGYTDEIEETGETFEENALIKAQTIYDYLKSKGTVCLVIADDSGLSVDALNGAPGVYSARYAGYHNGAANRKRLLEELQGETNRKAHFTTVLALVWPDGSHEFVKGETFGHITEKEIGHSDFGYDPLFFSDDLNKTYAEVSAEEKNKVSHRARAIKKLLEVLKTKDNSNEKNQ